MHPLHLLSPPEIQKASAILRQFVLASNPSSTTVWFKNISLEEPAKAQLLPYLEAEAQGVPPEDRPPVPRRVGIVHAAATENKGLFYSVVDLDRGIVVSSSRPSKGQHGPNDRFEVVAVSQKILAHPQVRDAIRELGLDPSTVQVDSWMFGADKDANEDTHKLIQGYLYARAPQHHTNLDSNQYAFPLPVSPVWDLWEDRLVEMVRLPTGATATDKTDKTDKTPPKTDKSTIAHLRPNEYVPELQKDGLRKDVKPLRVVQPEGASFTVSDGNLVQWQKWSFRVGFNYREGLHLHNIRYDSRPLFYRLSVSEMSVPYSDPRSPFHRKQAFDLGDAGAGSTANNLALGCDCLGSIFYLDAHLNDGDGQPVAMPHVVCLHEQDDGIGWKHTNSRTQRAVVTRRRILVVQSILTVGNYEYLFAWQFSQSGEVTLETRATGILSTQMMDADPNKTKSPYGNVVAPGVLAGNHQHLFSLRVDPMLDGPVNSVFQEESLPVPTHPEKNPHGNTWDVVQTPFEKAGFADASPQTNRCFKLVNENILNPISGNPVGYKIVAPPSQLILAQPGSTTRKRAQFAQHHVWVSQYRDGDLWAGGQWTNQSLTEKDGVADYVARGGIVRNADPVLWLTYGLTHNPRVEDFPVMPVETIKLELKPADFFDRNPAMDVPPSEQATNKSVLVCCKL